MKCILPVLAFMAGVFVTEITADKCASQHSEYRFERHSPDGIGAPPEHLPKGLP